MRQRCYLRIVGDSDDDASFHDCIADAVATFEESARELARYEQKLEASLHFVDTRGDEWAEYPDRVLSLGPKGGLRMERT